MAKLSYRDADGVLREHTLGRRTTIGRHPNQTVQVLDRVVSKQHAVIESEEEAYILRDRGSRNGTYLNGEEITEDITLSNGDRITVGSTDLYFQRPEQQDDDDRRTTSGNITMHTGDVQTHIRSNLLDRDSDQFLPEEAVGSEEVLRRDYEKLRIAHELSQSIGLEMDLDVLLQKIMDKAFELFPADRGVILLKREEEENADAQLIPPEREGLKVDEGELVTMVVKSRSGEEEEAEDVRISETILREVTSEKEACLSSDAMSDSRFSGSQSIMIGQIRSTMSVPMLHDDQLKGVIHLDTKMASGAFEEKDLAILTGFARRAAGLVEHHRLLKRMEQEIVVREKVGRLLSPELVEEVVNGRIELRKGGELRRATVMFADVRNFTSYSERMPPQEVVGNINDYFELMVDVIFEYEGTLDKFIGDEIMAIWGAPISRDNDPERAVRCAIAMQHEIEEFNKERRERGEVTFDIGIGLNTGEVVAGYTGSTKRMNYTVMGDEVNTANRICSSASAGEIYIGENTYADVGHLIEFEQLPPTELKGKAEQVEIYQVLGLRSDEHTTGNQTLPPSSDGEADTEDQTEPDRRDTDQSGNRVDASEYRDTDDEAPEMAQPDDEPKGSDGDA
jgi:adenylate cyclase